MQRPDVTDFHAFYRSRLGQAACRVLRGHIRALWPDMQGGGAIQQVLGVGYALPYLLGFLEKQSGKPCNRVAAMMPAAQGALHWPTGDMAEKTGNLSFLADEAALPLREASIDKLLVIHALEYADAPALMDEAFRVLAPGGTALFVTPNRAGLWARSDATPFGSGRPYTAGQLEDLLKDAGFLTLSTHHALFVPPTKSAILLRFSRLIEQVAVRLALPMGGVLVTLAEKRVAAPVKGTRAPVTRMRPSPSPALTLRRSTSDE